MVTALSLVPSTLPLRDSRDYQKEFHEFAYCCLAVVAERIILYTVKWNA